MIFIILTVVQSTLIFVAFKIFVRYNIDNWQAIVVNYIVATLFGFMIYNGSYSVSTIVEAPWITYALLLGLFFIGTFYFFALSSQKVGVALTSVASKMSVIIPVIFGVILYGDNMNLMRVLGILLALIAFYLTFKKGEKLSVNWKLMYLPILIFIGNGTIDTLMKYAEYHHINEDLILFLSTIFFVSLMVGFVVLIIRGVSGKVNFRWKNIVGGIILGMINFGSTFYMLKAMGEFESAILFPITNSSIVGLSALVGYIAFKEKLSLINWIGIAIAIAAIFIITNA